MKIDDRVRTITGREGTVRSIVDEAGGRVFAMVQLDADTDADGELKIPAGCLRVLPVSGNEQEKA